MKNINTDFNKDSKMVNYVAAKLGLLSRKEILQLYEKFQIPLENQVNIEELHITIFKSEKPFEFDGNQEDLLEPLDYNTVEIDYWNPKGDKMVLKVKSQFCDDIFESLNTDNKFVHDNYVAHITLARNLSPEQIQNLPERNKVIELKTYPIITSVFQELR